MRVNTWKFWIVPPNRGFFRDSRSEGWMGPVLRAVEKRKGHISRKGTVWFWLKPSPTFAAQWREWQGMCRKYKRKVRYRAFLRAVEAK